ncbi:hypothetical protein IEQ34_025212 [Dendrobium chrysotoxum]|uniref:JmjC domain-containing protein n=1 Tax=Dendrobium chrysotoxum TaxID=161865 RepID=A0AAV7FQU4_DENCH|nr:hypothetical protein IEQ34_025212 [Dendrobium chrysotoxum]
MLTCTRCRGCEQVIGVTRISVLALHFVALDTFTASLANRNHMPARLDEQSVDAAALRLAIEARSLLGLPTEVRDCSTVWVDTLASAPTALEFARHVVRHVPLLLIDGCIDDRTGLQRWQSTQYLIDAMGEEPVQVSLTPDGRADDLQSLDERDVFALPMEQWRSFRLMSDVREINGGSSKTHTSLVWQLCVGRCALGTEPEATNLWIGTSKSRTSMHREIITENLFTVIRGTKIFTLYPPCEAHFLCEDKPYEVYQWHRAPDDLWSLQPSDSTATPWIPIDPSLHQTPPENVRHERFAKALPPLIVRVHAGQTLFLPAGWYHHVTQEGDKEGFLCLCELVVRFEVCLQRSMGLGRVCQGNRQLSRD